MATSGVYGFDPELAELVDEAFEQCGIDPASLTGRHITSAMRSISLMLSDWINEGETAFPWERPLLEQTLTSGDKDFTIADGTFSIIDAVLVRDSVGIPMVPISEAEYDLIPKQTITGRPDRYVVGRSQGGTLTVTLYPVPENSTDVFRCRTMRSLQVPGALSETVDAMQNWTLAFAIGLAAQLAPKFAPEREDKLTMRARALLQRAISASRERVDVVIRAQGRRRRRRSA